MAKLGNRARMTVSSTGTGPVTLNLAVAGFQTFLDAGLSDGDKCRYVIEDASNAWEIGVGTLSNSSTVMARSVEESSNSGNPLNLTSAAEVFCGVTARDLDNAAPIFTTTPPSALTLKNDGSTAVTLNAKAYDENSGIPVSYSWDAWATGGTTIYDVSSLPPQLASAPSINQSTGAFSLVGSSNSTNQGTVNFRIKASDGVKVATHVSAVRLAFYPVTSGLLGLYDAAESASYSGSGTTWSDMSGNSGPNLTLTSTTYNASGIGGKPSFSFSALNSIKTTTSLGNSSTLVAIVQINSPTNPSSTPRLTFFSNGGSNTNPFGFDMYDGDNDRSMHEQQTYRLSSQNYSTAGTLTIDKVDRSSMDRDVAAGVMYSNTGAESQMHSIVLKTANLSDGFSLQSRVVGYGGGEVTTGQIRALAFYNRSITTTEISAIHDFFKGDYPSSAHMPA